MGKSSGWLCCFLNSQPHSSPTPTTQPTPAMSSWPTAPPPVEDEPIMVVAVSAPYKAVEISRRRCNVAGSAYVSKERAAVVVQAHFRSYLARRALRALKSLVKLQALVRGNIVRKQNTDKLLRMHALLRAQARACASRAQIFESPSSSAKSSQLCHHGPATPEKFEHFIQSNSVRRDLLPLLKRNGSKSTIRMMNDDIKGQSTKPVYEKADKVVEIDTVKSHFTPKRKNLFHSTHLSLPSDQLSYSFSTLKNSASHQTLPSLSSYDVRSFSPLKVTQDIDESPFCTAQNSPEFYTKSPFTPTKSDGSKSYLSGYSDHPSYMACTESSKAKIRSLSAPKQRPRSAKRYLVYNYEDTKISAQKASFVNKAYPGSGRLDRLGLPVINDGYLYRY